MSDFVSRNKGTWTELEQLVEKGRKSVSKLSVQELGRLDSLYRQTTVHLSQVTTATRDQNLINYLSQLTAAAHSLIYLPPRKSMLQGLFTLFTTGIAQAIARQWRYHLAALLLFFSGAFVAYYATFNDALMGYAIMPSMMEGRGPGATKEQLQEVLRSGRDEDGGQKFFFAAFLFSNNFKVAVLAMAAGILAVFPTVLIMFYNGMVIGVFVAIHHQAGISSEMWAWILPHGVTEMGAIILSGGMGLYIGKSVLAPGKFTAGESLKNAGKEAGIIIAASFAMLVFAAIVESYVRQSHWSTTTRMLFAGGTFAFWVAYIGFGFFLNAEEKRRQNDIGFLLTDSE